MPRGIQKGNLFPLHFHLVGVDVLGDAAASEAVTLDSRMASGRDVFPWSMAHHVTTGQRGWREAGSSSISSTLRTSSSWSGGHFHSKFFPHQSGGIKLISWLILAITPQGDQFLDYLGRRHLDRLGKLFHRNAARISTDLTLVAGCADGLLPAGLFPLGAAGVFVFCLRFRRKPALFLLPGDLACFPGPAYRCFFAFLPEGSRPAGLFTSARTSCFRGTAVSRFSFEPVPPFLAPGGFLFPLFGGSRFFRGLCFRSASSLEFFFTEEGGTFALLLLSCTSCVGGASSFRRGSLSLPPQVCALS